MVEVLPILSEATTTVQPADSAFNDPAFGQNDEALGPIRTADDFDCEVRRNVCQAVKEHRTCIAAVGKQLLEERELSEQRGQDHDAAVAILDISGRHQRVQQQTQRIDQNVPLLTFDQLSGIEAMGIDSGPPFSALFTLWLSMMQAVGLASRSSSSRHLT